MLVTTAPVCRGKGIWNPRTMQFSSSPQSSCTVSSCFFFPLNRLQTNQWNAYTNACPSHPAHGTTERPFGGAGASRGPGYKIKPHLFAMLAWEGGSPRPKQGAYHSKKQLVPSLSVGLVTFACTNVFGCHMAQGPDCCLTNPGPPHAIHGSVPTKNRSIANRSTSQDITLTLLSACRLALPRANLVATPTHIRRFFAPGFLIVSSLKMVVTCWASKDSPTPIGGLTWPTPARPPSEPSIEDDVKVAPGQKELCSSFVCLSVCLPACLPVCLSACLSVYLFVSVCWVSFVWWN